MSSIVTEGITLAAPARRGAALRLAAVSLLALAVVTLWVGIPAQPLYHPDEGRYARASQLMLETGDWIVPRINDQPRLQKPPVVHWLQAASLSVLGSGELAVRLPSAISITLTALMVLAMGRRVRDTTTGLIAAALLLITPLVMICGRLAIIDPILTLFWTGATFSGYLATQGKLGTRNSELGTKGNEAEPNPSSELRVPRSEFWLFWLFVSAAVLTKGPVGLLPALVLLTWAVLTGQWSRRELGRWALGLLIATAPLLLWVLAVIRSHPRAVEVWHHEIIDRFKGAGDHPQPFYFHLIVLIAGFFPATAMLPLPWMHFGPADVRRSLAQRSIKAYLGIAVLVPLIVLSLNSGKLVTYILPLGPAVALLAAMGLRDWLDVPLDRREIKAAMCAKDTRGCGGTADPWHPISAAARRLPDGIDAVAIAVTVAWGAAMVLAHERGLAARIGLDESMRLTLAAIAGPLIVTVAMAWAAAALWRGAGRRGWAMVLVGFFFCAAHLWALTLTQQRLTIPQGPRQLLAAVHRHTGGAPLQLSTLGFEDLTLSFYADQSVPNVEKAPELLRREARVGERRVVLATAEEWRKFAGKAPDAASRFEKVMDWPHRRGAMVVMVERNAAAVAESRSRP